MFEILMNHELMVSLILNNRAQVVKLVSSVSARGGYLAISLESMNDLLIDGTRPLDLESEA